MDVKWVKIRSWHAVRDDAIQRDPSRVGFLWATHCGRLASGAPTDDLPAEKSCESCLRIIARLSDA